MKTKAVRLYEKNDLRFEEFELAPLLSDEVRVKIITDSLCMSTYKGVSQGKDHKRIPNNIDTNPIIIGHECCGDIIEVGDKWKTKFKVGDKVTMQPAHFYHGQDLAPGFSYENCGGDATYVNIPMETLEMDCLVKYDSDVYFYGSLAEPMDCIIAGFRAMYHKRPGEVQHEMGIVEGGCLALLASAGPMGLGAIDYALHCDRRPRLIVVTDIDNARLERAKMLYTVEHAREIGIELHYINTLELGDNAVKHMRSLTDGHGFNDLIVFAPVKAVIEQADELLAKDGCMNFFAGPTDTALKAEVNFYNIHYASTHMIGTAGGSTDDMREAVELMNQGRINPAGLVTHVGGLNAVKDATLNLPKIPGGKKLIYCQIEMPLTALNDFAKSDDPIINELGKIIAKHNNLWCTEAEEYLLKNAKSI